MRCRVALRIKEKRPQFFVDLRVWQSIRQAFEAVFRPAAQRGARRRAVLQRNICQTGFFLLCL